MKKSFTVFIYVFYPRTYIPIVTDINIYTFLIIYSRNDFVNRKIGKTKGFFGLFKKCKAHNGFALRIVLFNVGFVGG